MLGKRSVPVPDCVTVPVPLMGLEVVMLSDRLKTKALLSVTDPVPSEPTVPPLPTCRVPAVAVVVPV